MDNRVVSIRTGRRNAFRDKIIKRLYTTIRDVQKKMLSVEGGVKRGSKIRRFSSFKLSIPRCNQRYTKSRSRFQSVARQLAAPSSTYRPYLPS